MLSKFLGVGLVVGAVVSAAAACSSSGPANLGDCHDGVAGCACDQIGQSAACGTEISQTESTVTCSVGKSSCDGKTWSVCAGDHVETKSKPGSSLTAGGLTTLGAVVPCSNLCDPNECHSYQDDENDVDASGVAKTDAGLTLSQGDGGGGGPCTGLKCNVPNCGQGKTTSISGFVYDPANANPLYNVYVYVPIDATGKVAALPTGASQIQCSNQTTISAVTVTQTAVDGSFTLTGIPAGVNIPLVMQSGQWRREIMLKSSAITSCGANTVTATSCVNAISAANCALRLPKNHTDGYDWNNGLYDFADVPQLAIVTGNADPFECLLLKMGIDPLEFGSTTSNATRRVHFFESPDDPGTVLASTYGNRVTGDALWNTNAILKNYAAILFPCEGAAVDKMNGKAGVPKTSKLPGVGINPYSNLIAYANAGGRVFATHYSYVWLEYPAYFNYVAGDNWGAVATWDHAYANSVMNTSTYATQDPLAGTIDQNFAKGKAFAQWLVDVGASSSLGTLNLHEARHDVVTLGATTQDWSVANDTGSGVSPASFNPNFTFNTPYPAIPANQYGRVVFSDFHVSSAALTNTNLQSNCTASTDCGYTQTCVGYKPKGPGTCSEPCYSSNDCANTSYTCKGATLGTCGMTACTKKNQCGGGACTNGVCVCSANSQCQSGVCSNGKCTAATCTTTCGGAEVCNGSVTKGACTKSCLANADCGGGELCLDASLNACNGGTCTCTGCLASTQCTSKLGGQTCNNVVPQVNGSCTPAMPSNAPNNSNGWFPYACANQPMIAQEQALEFMFFDLTSCVAPDNALPPGPPPYKSAVFTQDFTGTCPTGQSVAWREFDWQATIPSGTSIAFAAQSGPNANGLLNATPTSLVTTTTSTAIPAYDAVIIDTSTGGTTTGTGPFNKASPPVRSDTLLRVTITMNPDTAGTVTPTLKSWKVQYDCTASQ